MNGHRSRKLATAFDKWAADYHDVATDKIARRGYSYAALGSTIATIIGPDAEQILEVGVGTAVLGAEVGARTTGALHGVDISPAMLECASAARAYASLTRANAERLPFAADTFDATFTAFCIHSVSKLDRAVHELLRVTKKGQPCIVVDLFPESRFPWLSELRGRIHSWLYEFGAPACYRPVQDFVGRLIMAEAEIMTVKRLGAKRAYQHYLVSFRRGDT